jgi:hypothetical protein
MQYFFSDQDAKSHYQFFGFLLHFHWKKKGCSFFGANTANSK